MSLRDASVNVPSGERGEGSLCFASVDALLPKNSAESKFVAGFGPEAGERAEKGSLLGRASKAVASHLARLALRTPLALLS